MKMAVFWVVTPCSHGDGPDDGGSKDLWNVGDCLPDNTALQLIFILASVRTSNPTEMINVLENNYIVPPLWMDLIQYLIPIFKLPNIFSNKCIFVSGSAKYDVF
jgi:hypothetical protein